MPLIERRPVRGAHRCGIVAPASSHPDAAQRGVHQRTVVLVEGIPGRAQADRFAEGREPDVRIERVRVDDFPWVHEPVGVPEVLELAERVHELGTEHRRQKLAPALAVTVLTRKRTT